MNRAAPRRRSGLVAVMALAALLALTAVLELSVAALAAKGPAKVHPQLRVTAAGVTGRALHFTVEVSFEAPAGSAACRGRVKLAAKAKPGREAPRWSAGLVAEGVLCEAEVNGKLPAALLDHQVAFELSFPGNGRVARFSTPRKLKLTAPAGPQPGGGGAGDPGGAGSPPAGPQGGGSQGPTTPAPGSQGPATPTPGSPGPVPPAPAPPTLPAVPYTAANGHWQGGGLWDTGSGSNVAFRVEAGVIHDINLFSSVILRCEKKDSVPEVTLRYALFPNAPEIPLQGPTGTFFEKFTERRDDASADEEIPWVLHGELGASSGTMAIEAHDASFDEHFSGGPEYTLSECHVSTDLTVGKH